MSQPLDFTHSEDPLARQINDIDDLKEIFFSAQRTPDSFLLGLEYEFFCVFTGKDLEPMPFDGPLGIEKFFTFIAKKSQNLPKPFTPLFDEKRVVALHGESAIIALEPGGQIELALKPESSYPKVISSLDECLAFLEKCAKEFNGQFLAVGLHPKNTKEQMAKVEKSRYKIMHNYMAQKGTMGHEMMYKTASIQINIDYENEADMVKKLRLAAVISPMFSALSSNACFNEAKKVKEKSFRLKIWSNTDNDRCKIPAIIFDKDFSFQSWINYALDVPMYFIRRNHKYLDLSENKLTFRAFLQKGFKGHKPTLRDFHDHLSTIFTEVRLKPFIELRSMDCMPVVYVNAFVALVWALFYHQDTFEHFSKRFEDSSFQEVSKLLDDVVFLGGQALFQKTTVWTILRELLEKAQQALGANKGILEPLILIAQKECSLTDFTNEMTGLKTFDTNFFYQNLLVRSSTLV